MATFPLGHHAHLTRLHNAREQARTQRAAPTPAPRTTFEFPNPTDLRGIPAIGISVPGHIAGTQPENQICR